jgi:hypothetical protein
MDATPCPGLSCGVDRIPGELGIRSIRVRCHYVFDASHKVEFLARIAVSELIVQVMKPVGGRHPTACPENSPLQKQLNGVFEEESGCSRVTEGAAEGTICKSFEQVYAAFQIPPGEMKKVLRWAKWF